jgi:diphosphoinositol-polyphosphate diphosphatase
LFIEVFFSFTSSYQLVFLLSLSLYSALSLYQQFLGFYDFKSKTHQDACCPEGMCRAAVFALHVKEELASWPEQSTRRRTWLTLPEATSQCRYQWMQEALVTGFSDWHDNWSKGGGSGNNHSDPV